MKSCFSDAAIFFEKIADNLPGSCATYVSDALHAVDTKYSYEIKATEAKLRCKLRE